MGKIEIKKDFALSRNMDYKGIGGQCCDLERIQSSSIHKRDTTIHGNNWV